MLLIAHVLTAVVLLIHVYIVLLETVLFRSRGLKVFALSPERAGRAGVSGAYVRLITT